MRILAAVTLVTLLGASSPAPTEAPKPPVSLRGRLASVTLAKVSRKVGAEASAACPGAKEALEFVFLIAPVGDGVDPAFSRDVSLEVDGESPEKSSRPDSPPTPRPVLVVKDVPDLLAEFPDVREVASQDPKPGLGLVITVGGAPYPASGTGALAFSAGYHRTVEPFRFRFSLPPRPGA